MRHASVWFWLSVAALSAPAIVLALSMGASSARAQGDATVSIVDFAFQPGSVEVAVGDTVTWTNNGSATHTVTSDSGAFDSGQLAPGASFSQTFDTAGTFTYHCAIHPQMTGTVIVTGGGEAQATAAAPAQSGNETAAPAAQTNRVPRTGVGTLATGNTGKIALLAAAIAALLAGGAVVAARRA